MIHARHIVHCKVILNKIEIEIEILGYNMAARTRGAEDAAAPPDTTRIKNDDLTIHHRGTASQ